MPAPFTQPSILVEGGRTPPFPRAGGAARGARLCVQPGAPAVLAGVGLKSVWRQRAVPESDSELATASGLSRLPGAVEMACKAQAAFAPQTAGIHSYYHGKIEELESVYREKAQNLRRLEAQRNELNGKVRLLREELQLLQEPGSYVGEVVKAMGKTKVLVKVNPEGKYVVDLDKNIDVTEIKPNLRVALRNDSYVLHKVGPGASAQCVGVCVCAAPPRERVSVALNSEASAFVFNYASVNRMCQMCTDTLAAQNAHRFGSVL